MAQKHPLQRSRGPTLKIPLLLPSFPGGTCIKTGHFPQYVHAQLSASTCLKAHERHAVLSYKGCRKNRL